MHTHLTRIFILIIKWIFMNDYHVHVGYFLLTTNPIAFKLSTLSIGLWSNEVLWSKGNYFPIINDLNKILVNKQYMWSNSRIGIRSPFLLPLLFSEHVMWLFSILIFSQVLVATISIRNQFIYLFIWVLCSCVWAQVIASVSFEFLNNRAYQKHLGDEL